MLFRVDDAIAGFGAEYVRAIPLKCWRLHPRLSRRRIQRSVGKSTLRPNQTRDALKPDQRRKQRTTHPGIHPFHAHRNTDLIILKAGIVQRSSAIIRATILVALDAAGASWT